VTADSQPGAVRAPSGTCKLDSVSDREAIPASSSKANPHGARVSQELTRRYSTTGQRHGGTETEESWLNFIPQPITDITH